MFVLSDCQVPHGLMTICHFQEDEEGMLVSRTMNVRSDTANDHMKHHEFDYYGGCIE